MGSRKVRRSVDDPHIPAPRSDRRRALRRWDMPILVGGYLAFVAIACIIALIISLRAWLRS